MLLLGQYYLQVELFYYVVGVVSCLAHLYSSRPTRHRILCDPMPIVSIRPRTMHSPLEMQSRS